MVVYTVHYMFGHEKKYSYISAVSKKHARMIFLAAHDSIKYRVIRVDVMKYNE